MKDMDGTLREVNRVLKPGGRVVASVNHPCFKNRDMKCTLEEKIKVIVADYFNPMEYKSRCLYSCSWKNKLT